MLEELCALPEPFGEAARRARSCIQCGVCSASCPLSERMRVTPRKLLAALLAGDDERASGADTPAFCTSCLACTVRCPARIDFSLLNCALKAARGDSAFYRAFTRRVRAHGRVADLPVFASFAARRPRTALPLLLAGARYTLSHGLPSLRSAASSRGTAQLRAALKTL